jgi:hypothetical protein
MKAKNNMVVRYEECQNISCILILFFVLALETNGSWTLHAGLFYTWTDGIPGKVCTCAEA